MRYEFRNANGRVCCASNDVGLLCPRCAPLAADADVAAAVAAARAKSGATAVQVTDAEVRDFQELKTALLALDLPELQAAAAPLRSAHAPDGFQAALEAAPKPYSAAVARKRAEGHLPPSMQRWP